MEQVDWDALKSQMESPEGYMKLQCDEYVLSLAQATDPKRKSWYTTIYVDGQFIGSWFQCDRDTGEPVHEQTRRFMQRKTNRLYSPKRVEEYRKIVGKREAAKLEAIKFFTYNHYWTSFNSLKKHLIANNKQISRLH